MQMIEASKASQKKIQKLGKQEEKRIGIQMLKAGEESQQTPVG